MRSDGRPIAALASAAAPAAIAVIRTSGAGAVELVASRFSRPCALLEATGHTLHHGAMLDHEGAVLDDVLVAVFRAPASYTGEESVEISCHGSVAGVRRVLRELYAVGFAAAAAGEFTRRAFLNGKLDLTRAEAVNEIVRAQTEAGHALALDRLGGSVERAVGEIRARLVGLMAHLAIQLDYPEEETGEVVLDPREVERAADAVAELVAGFRRGRLFQEGARVVLAGRTNAGKSSLFNQLLRQDRSIVSDSHGTTRDYVEALIDVDGIPVRLFDTAGLRSAAGSIEEEGIRRSRRLIESADLVVYVVDAVDGVTEEDRDRLAAIELHGTPLLVLNKIDLVPGAPGARAAEGADVPVHVSARSGDGIDALNAALAARLLAEDGARSGAAVIDSERQRDLLVRAREALERVASSLREHMPADAVAVDLQDALDAIGEITGEVTSAEILDAMFSGFCVGK